MTTRPASRPSAAAPSTDVGLPIRTPGTAVLVYRSAPKSTTVSTWAVFGNRSIPVTVQLVTGVEQRARVARERRHVARHVDDARRLHPMRPASASFDMPVRGGSTMNVASGRSRSRSAGDAARNARRSAARTLHAVAKGSALRLQVRAADRDRLRPASPLGAGGGQRRGRTGRRRHRDRRPVPAARARRRAGPAARAESGCPERTRARRGASARAGDGSPSRDVRARRSRWRAGETLDAGRSARCADRPVQPVRERRRTRDGRCPRAARGDTRAGRRRCSRQSRRRPGRQTLALRAATPRRAIQALVAGSSCPRRARRRRARACLRG